MHFAGGMGPSRLTSLKGRTRRPIVITQSETITLSTEANEDSRLSRGAIPRITRDSCNHSINDREFPHFLPLLFWGSEDNVIGKDPKAIMSKLLKSQNHYFSKWDFSFPFGCNLQRTDPYRCGKRTDFSQQLMRWASWPWRWSSPWSRLYWNQYV